MKYFRQGMQSSSEGSHGDNSFCFEGNLFEFFSASSNVANEIVIIDGALLGKRELKGMGVSMKIT